MIITKDPKYGVQCVSDVNTWWEWNEDEEEEEHEEPGVPPLISAEELIQEIQWSGREWWKWEVNEIVEEFFLSRGICFDGSLENWGSLLRLLRGAILSNGFFLRKGIDLYETGRL